MTRQSPRFRRLRTDNNALTTLKSESSILDFVAHGNPPDHYLVTFRGRGFFRPDGTNRVSIREEHQVSISLGASYPRLMPELQWKTPIFHPNISGSGVVCLGGYGTYWVPSLNLDELCEMLWDMIRYANFDINSPYNRDAANWARMQSDFRLPIDQRPIRDRVAAGQVTPSDKGKSKTDSTSAATNKSNANASKSGGSNEGDILFLDDSDLIDVVDAELIDGGDDADVLIIE